MLSWIPSPKGIDSERPENQNECTYAEGQEKNGGRKAEKIIFDPFVTNEVFE